MILPSSLSIIRQMLVEPAALARGIALWATAGGVAVSIGPLLGGLLTSELGWQAIFLVNVPIGVAGAASLRRLPRSKPRFSPMDLAGQLSAVTALVGLTFAITEGGRYAVPALGVFGVSTIAFFVIESRLAHPAVPLGLFRSNPFIAATSTGFVMNLAYFGLCFILTLYFQQIRGATPVVTGLMFIPMTASTMVGNLLAGRLITRYGTRIPLTVGQTVEALGFGALLFIGPSTPIIITLTALVPIGFGAGLTSPPMTTALLRAVAVEHAGAASGVLGVVRQVGGVLGVATFGAVATFHRRSHRAASAVSRSDRSCSVCNTRIEAITDAGMDGRPLPEGNRSSNSPSGNTSWRCSAKNANMLPSATR